MKPFTRYSVTQPLIKIIIFTLLHTIEMPRLFVLINGFLTKCYYRNTTNYNDSSKD